MQATRKAHVLAGIDEAGLGPMLGPLAMGLCALEFQEPIAEDTPRELWTWLQEAVAEKASVREARLVVADSKEVFQRSERGWLRLQATALAFLRAARDPAARDAPADSWRFEDWLVPASPPLGAPWYADLPAHLPDAAQRLEIDDHSTRLQRALAAHRGRLLEAGIHLMPARDLNASFHATGSKATTTWQVTVGLLSYLMSAHGKRGVWAIVDRQGGRKHYGKLLERDFPGCGVVCESESPTRSDYWVFGPEGDLWVSFRVSAESQNLPTAAASCLAKYGREISMRAFNAYFATQIPDLKPTAGYVTDARRWLQAAGSALSEVLRSAELRNADIIRER